MKKAKISSTYRLSERTRMQIKFLAECYYHTSEADVIKIAVNNAFVVYRNNFDVSEKTLAKEMSKLDWGKKMTKTDIEKLILKWRQEDEAEKILIKEFFNDG